MLALAKKFYHDLKTFTSNLKLFSEYLKERGWGGGGGLNREGRLFESEC